MKKRIIRVVLAVTLLISFVQVYSQNQNANLKKYWYYRQRFFNNFIVLGANHNHDEPGTNYPVSRIYYSKPIFDEANFAMPHYLSFLATEYRLLKNNGKDYSQTIDLLYHALMTVNRLDRMAEHYYNFQFEPPQDADLNGFIIRRDQTDGFWNKYKLGGTTQYFKHDSLEEQFSLISPNENLLMINDSGDDCGDFNLEMSEDVVWNYLMGLSLVNKLVDNEVVDGQERNFRQMAKDITRRMVGYMHHSIPKIVNFIPYTWYVENPVRGGLVCQGDGTDGTMLIVSHGFAKAANFILGTNEFAGMSVSKDVFEYVLTNNTFSVSVVLSSWAAACPGPTAMAIQEASISYGIWKVNLSTTPFPGGCVEIPKTRKEIEKSVESQYNVRVLAAVGNTWVDGHSPYYWLKRKEDFDTVCKFEHLPLIWCVLNDNYSEITTHDREHIENLLNIAPDCGPYAYPFGVNSGDWSSISRLVSPEQNRGGAFTASAPTGLYQSEGNFSGLDYMILHNLYLLTKSTSMPFSVSASSCDGDVYASNEIHLSTPLDPCYPLDLYSGSTIRFETGFSYSGSYDVSLHVGNVPLYKPAFFKPIPLTDYSYCDDFYLK